jgi:hypothetical protein
MQAPAMSAPKLPDAEFGWRYFVPAFGVGVGDAGKIEGQPHASPLELAIDTLGQFVRLR